MSIDGGDTGVSRQFRVLPGEHTLSVQIYRIGKIMSAYPQRPAKEIRIPVCMCQFELDTWAGATYLVDSRELAGDVWIAFARSTNVGREIEPDPENLPHCTCRP